MSKIVIDAGHGGTDPGAVFDGTKEKELALAFAESLGHELRVLGETTEFTRVGDTFVAVMDRADTVVEGDIFVSVHVNSAENATANGVSVWYHGGSSSGKSLATYVFNGIKALGYLSKYGAGIISDKTRYANGFGVLREATQRKSAGAVLVELGFIKNKADRAAITNSRKRNLMARGAAYAILAFINDTK